MYTYIYIERERLEKERDIDITARYMSIVLRCIMSHILTIQWQSADHVATCLNVCLCNVIRYTII